MTDPNVPSVPNLGDIHDGERAVREVMPELEALPPEKVRKPNVAATDAASIAAGAFESIMFFREAIRDELPRFDLRNIDRLKLYTLAAWHTASTNRSSGTSTSFDQLVHDAMDLSDDFAIAGNALMRKKLVDPVKFQRSGTSFRAVADDLNSRVKALRDAWSSIEGKTTVTLADLDRGADLAGRIVLDIQNAGNPPPTTATDLRYRAWTLFEVAYEQCRRAIQYLRYDEGDADKFIPPLRQMAKGRRDPADAESKATETKNATNANDASTNTPGNPNVINATGAPVAPATPSAPVSTGRPIGGDDAPFVKDSKK